MIRFVSALIVLAALGACGRASPYPNSYKVNFMQSCQVAGSSETRCACIWGHVETEVPKADFDALESAMRTGGSTPTAAKIDEFTRLCPEAPAGGN